MKKRKKEHPSKTTSQKWPVKKTLTIPQWLNDAALKADINFSQVLQEALMKKVGSL